MASGYTTCPCCGDVTVSNDVTNPELCSICEDAGCDGQGDCQAVEDLQDLIDEMMSGDSAAFVVSYHQTNGE